MGTLLHHRPVHCSLALASFSSSSASPSSVTLLLAHAPPLPPDPQRAGPASPCLPTLRSEQATPHPSYTRPSDSRIARSPSTYASLPSALSLFASAPALPPSHRQPALHPPSAVVSAARSDRSTTMQVSKNVRKVARSKVANSRHQAAGSTHLETAAISGALPSTVG